MYSHAILHLLGKLCVIIFLPSVRPFTSGLYVS